MAGLVSASRLPDSGELATSPWPAFPPRPAPPYVDLDKLQPDDEIIVTTTAGRFRFVVVGTKIVQPSDASVLAPSADVRLTLTTCDPRYSTAHRLIVTAVLDPTVSG